MRLWMSAMLLLLLAASAVAETSPGPLTPAQAELAVKAKAGDAKSAERLGLMLMAASDPAARRLAGPFVRMAVDGGERRGARNLAIMFQHDDAAQWGLTRDLALAARYFRMSAEDGNARSMLSLARIYARGDGVEASLPTARQWQEAALATGRVDDDARKMGETLDRLEDLDAQLAETDRRLEENRQKQAENLAAQAAIRKTFCERTRVLCGRGCLRRDDGVWLYNTRDGRQWYDQYGWLIPANEAPDFSCPQP